MRKWYFHSKKTEEMNNHNNTNPHFSRPIFFCFSFVPPLFLLCSSVPNSVKLLFGMVLSPTLHRVCTDFGTEEERSYNGTTAKANRNHADLTLRTDG